MRYLVVVQETDAGWRAQVPDLPGCEALASTRGEALARIRVRIGERMEELREQGVAPPEANAQVEMVEVSPDRLAGEVIYGPPPRGAYDRMVREPAARYGDAAESARTVVVDAEEYEDLLYTVDLLRGIHQADREVEAGIWIPHEQVMAELRAKYGSR